MAVNDYKPEGSRIGTIENRGYISSLQGLEKAMNCGKILEAPAVLCDNDLNLTVDLGEIKGIIPKEEIALSENGGVKDIAVITRVGKAVCFKVIALENDKNGEPIAILSRKAAQKECMNSFLLSLIPGDILLSKITHLEHFGAFVDIGCGIISLLSIDCISVSRISHPKDRFSVGSHIYTVIKSIDYITGRIYVSHKELLGTWEENAAAFAVGQTVAGIVRSIEEYGVFVELTPNLAGLAELRDGIQIGQSAAVYIKNIIKERMKIKLVLIDSCRDVIKNQNIKYYIDTENCHRIDYWRYSPIECRKIIETDFRVNDLI